jgi:hypothetical protein
VRSRYGPAVLALALALPAYAAPPEMDIPAEVRPSGGYVRFTPKTNAKSVVYVGLSGVDPFPSEELKDGRRFLLPVAGLPDGAYKFAAVGTLNDEQTRRDFTVVIGNPAPPPNPPGPTPPPGPPASDLGKKFQAAYDAGKDPDSLTRLRTAMDGAIVLARSPDYATVKALVGAINTNTKATVGEGKLPALGRAIGDHLATQLPAADGPIDQDRRALFVNAYLAVAAALKEVK